MLKYNGKEFRNLEEQVGYLTAAFNSGKLIDELGIKVLGVFPDLNTAKEAIRPPYEYGDAFEIGTTKPYNLYIYTRDIEDFFDFGPFPAPGPQGKLGPTPIISINANVTDTTGTPEATVTKTGTDEAPIFNFTFKNIKGERGREGMQGIQGPKGNTGATGPIGPQGIKGDKGDTGPAFKLLGNLTSTSQLPTPTAELQSQGASYTIPNAEGIKHLWVIQGTDNLLWVDFGVSGIQGPKGEDGIGINNLQTVQDIGASVVTYNLTDGITIHGTERYTYSSGQVDVTTEREIPIIAGDGINIDANEQGNGVVISNTSNLENGEGQYSLIQKVAPSTTTDPNNYARGKEAVALGRYDKAYGDRSMTVNYDNENYGRWSFVANTKNKNGSKDVPQENVQSNAMFGCANEIKVGIEGLVAGKSNVNYEGDRFNISGSENKNHTNLTRMSGWKNESLKEIKTPITSGGGGGGSTNPDTNPTEPTQPYDYTSNTGYADISGTENKVFAMGGRTRGVAGICYSPFGSTEGFWTKAGYLVEDTTKSTETEKYYKPQGLGAKAFGRATHAKEDFTIAGGEHSVALKKGANAIGYYTTANTEWGTAIGKYNVGKTNALFEVGNGYAVFDAGRKNAFEVLDDGRAKVQTAPIDDDDVVRKGDLTNIGGGGGKLYRHTLNFTDPDGRFIYGFLYKSNNTPYTLNTVPDYMPIIVSYGPYRGVGAIVEKKLTLFVTSGSTVEILYEKAISDFSDTITEV